ncbi:TPA_asm: cytochrome b/b6 domain-containing protein [Salmonella enterica subsp. enterica serovar Java]|uniref:Cytochrome b/b6 domain-containing protein n=1 Tax=Salmonella dublin TaxID=98360 RepID=A0A732D1B7_SALDU|nr:cytochrome b/b6 domain-containing protein [Salmonella enterica]EAW1288328.1 cytochrome b/b6 domain-containing protein [Salmonella enterica subsp. enterica]ECI2267581.1 cytochrome b/b6 domain-containing protein [Salmonella enterica subsp. enterica serovar Wandsworth]EDK5264387.1 cytochrome b/b6 domain-containing protein [Salmonella enterica subsp. enterica serovar Enteritidis]EDU1385342.1 cytochrome b/b6 domain-containing protein [Salmonella enterica subsp. enterica serovar 4,[5],12:b:-]EGZ3
MLKKLWFQLPHREFPGFRLLHIVIAALILFQIINSNLISSDALGQTGISNIMTWLHIFSGTGLIVLGIVMLVWMLVRRGGRYYFCWLFMDFRGIKQDIFTLRQFRLPDAHAGGIAATIQGLGVLALLAVALSGALWFLLDYFAVTTSLNTEQIISLHKFLTGFIEAYFFAHGAMGLLHMALSYSVAARSE